MPPRPTLTKPPLRRVSVVILATNPPLFSSVAKQGGVSGECGQIPKFSPCGGLKIGQNLDFWAFQSKFQQQNFSAFGRKILLRNKGGVSGEGGGLVARITTDVMYPISLPLSNAYHNQRRQHQFGSGPVKSAGLFCASMDTTQSCTVERLPEGRVFEGG